MQKNNRGEPLRFPRTSRLSAYASKYIWWRIAAHPHFNRSKRVGSERRQCGGFRPFKRSGLNSRFVPFPDIVQTEQRSR